MSWNSNIPSPLSDDKKLYLVEMKETEIKGLTRVHIFCVFFCPCFAPSYSTSVPSQQVQKATLCKDWVKKKDKNKMIKDCKHITSSRFIFWGNASLHHTLGSISLLSLLFLSDLSSFVFLLVVSCDFYLSHVFLYLSISVPCYQTPFDSFIFKLTREREA